VIVLDASFVVAYFNEDDAHHGRAAAVWPELVAGAWGPVLLPEYIFVEVVTVLAARTRLDRAAARGVELLDAAEFEFVPCSPLFLDAFEVFRTQRGTQLSFADSGVVAVARARGAEHVATFDDDFRRVAGIKVVPS
jgi:predicted nucleic acid-binding protein